MKKIARVFVTFIIFFIIIYLVGSYIAHGIIGQVHWTEGVTIWDKLREYYIRTAPYNIKPVLVITLIITACITIIRESKGK